MNHFIVRENDTKSFNFVSTEWSKTELQQIGQLDVISEHETKADAKIEMLKLQKLV